MLYDRPNVNYMCLKSGLDKHTQKKAVNTVSLEDIVCVLVLMT